VQGRRRGCAAGGGGKFPPVDDGWWAGSNAGVFGTPKTREGPAQRNPWTSYEGIAGRGFSENLRLREFFGGGLRGGVRVVLIFLSRDLEKK